MTDKAKTTLNAELSHIKASAHDAAKSGAYMYPLKGILYFTTHKSLWKPFLSRASATATVAATVTTSMFLFTYLPQVALLTFTSGPLAPISAALLVLSESSSITTFLSRTFLLRTAFADTFDATLLAKDQNGLVARGREIRATGTGAAGTDPMAKLGKMLKRPFEGSFTPGRALVRSVVLLPLNFVPVVGTLVYVVVQGKKIGPVAHERYFQLKGFDEVRREQWVGRFRGGYTSFGIAAYALEMVPLVSLLFAFTNTVGAALWAADLEKTVQ